MGTRKEQQGQKNLAALSAEEKAKADASKARYEALKAKYELAIKEQEMKNAMTPANTAPNFRKVLRDRLFGEGKIGDDMQFKFVTGDNILGVYQNFVDAVADSKTTIQEKTGMKLMCFTKRWIPVRMKLRKI
ncbi:MAG: hypothetical protein IPN43_17715 [Chitinophagaceae bacterium]|nr:hypothetical protein [Chitinophagaceae bacterium]